MGSGRWPACPPWPFITRSILFFLSIILLSPHFTVTLLLGHHLSSPATRLNNQPTLFKFTMQFKLLAALLFGATALALPQATGTSSSSATDEETALLDSIPSSILTVMETAIPANWWSEIMDPSSRDSIISEIQAGTMPAWYNNLPSSVKAWATTAGANFAESLLGGSAVATATGMATADANAATGTASVAIATATASGSSGLAGSAGSSAAVSSLVSSAPSATTPKAGSASSAAPSAASSAASSAHASATSTGGAPVATGSVALSMAGVAGILGLALAL